MFSALTSQADVSSVLLSMLLSCLTPRRRSSNLFCMDRGYAVGALSWRNYRKRSHDGDILAGLRRG